MTDRELLEKAAKAAGYEVSWSEKYECAEVWRDGDKRKSFFNTLVDDGDALRLRNRVGAVVADEGDCCYVSISRYGVGRIEVREYYDRDLKEGYSSDRAVDAATRRAITRAAATIQEAKEAV